MQQFGQTEVDKSAPVSLSEISIPGHHFHGILAVFFITEPLPDVERIG
jgi:hypothetical protein